MTGGDRPRRAPIPRGTARRAVPGAPMRRTRPVRRASAGLSPVRAGAALVLLVSAATIYGVANSSAFVNASLDIEGAVYTATEDLEAAVAPAAGVNLFALSTGPLETRLRELPTVADASVSVRLPDVLAVRIIEREPILVWELGVRHYLVDIDGTLFARLDPDAPPEAAAGLPRISDRRAGSVGLAVGRTLSPVDLDAARRLASLVPADVGSEADRLDVIVNDASGFILVGRSIGWRAVFGFYTASLRTPEIIPGQVRLLRSLLVGREQLVERVILASETDGTYVPRPTPRPTPEPSP
ncbi:MAG: cell division protein FtsQ/DivIB [Candidatus Limnocylindria bacterium]